MFGWISSIDIYAIIWLILTIAFAGIELATVGLVTIWFAAGSIAALLVASLGWNFFLQVVVFLLVSIALLVATRPLAAEYVNRRASKTNVDAIIGSRALVTERVSNLNQTGRAVVNGQDWSIRTEVDNMIIEPGEMVEVIRVSGVKLIVKKIMED